MAQFFRAVEHLAHGLPTMGQYPDRFRLMSLNPHPQASQQGQGHQTKQSLQLCGGCDSGPLRDHLELTGLQFLEPLVCRQVVLHALRHAKGTRSIQAGFQLQDVAEYLGHSDVQMVRTYAKWADERLKKHLRHS